MDSLTNPFETIASVSPSPQQSYTTMDAIEDEEAKHNMNTPSKSKSHPVRDNLSKHMQISDRVDSLRSTSSIGGFPDTQTVHHAPDLPKKAKKEKRKSNESPKKGRSSFKIKQQQFSRTYYLTNDDNENMQYSYFHSRIKDKLVWYQDIEKLLPSTIPGQFIYALLNMIFPSDLYYSFHRYSFKDGFKTEHRMDDFFTSRRVLSIQETIPGLFPSLLWYKIIKYEPTPYKSMCYYQYIRQNDADKIYKLPCLFGFAEMILVCILTLIFCINIDDEIVLFNFDYRHFNPKSSINHPSSLFLFDPLSYINICGYALLFVTLLHLSCIFIVWRIIWFLHFKIYDYKQRVYAYLSRRRAKEMQFIESLHVGNKSKINREAKYRVYYRINNHSYLYYKRNGELFISLLKWLNVIEYEQNLDFFITSKKNWCIITFALHKYVGILIYVLFILFGVTFVTTGIFLIYFSSYWIHCIELYTSDHHNLSSKSNEDFLKKKSFIRSLCNSILKIFKILLWPGFLFYVCIAYCMYIMLFHPSYFPVVWLGVCPIWLIVYSVLTRGYRRIYIYNALALIMLYFMSVNWFLFREWHLVMFRYSAAVFIILFQFMWHISMQLETHRAMLFPQLSKEYKADERAQHKFGGLHVSGAKLYTFVQYAAMYFKKSTSTTRTYKKDGKTHQVRVSGDFAEDTYKDPWYMRWYLQRPYDSLRIPKPSFPFVYK